MIEFEVEKKKRRGDLRSTQIELNECVTKLW